MGRWMFCMQLLPQWDSCQACAPTHDDNTVQCMPPHLCYQPWLQQSLDPTAHLCGASCQGWDQRSLRITCALGKHPGSNCICSLCTSPCRRMFAEILVHIGVANNTHVGMYALLGAAGFLGGLMRMSAAQVCVYPRSDGPQC